MGIVWAVDTAWLIWLCIWIALAWRVKRVVQRERASLRAAHLVPMNIAAVLLFFRSPGGHTWLEQPMLARAVWMAPAGLLLVVLGLGFAVWARLELAGNWSGTVTLKQDHELIQRGPYRFVRHPIYTGLLGAVLGTAIAIDQRRGAASFVLMTAAFVIKLRTEEAFMLEAFGAQYAAYRRRVAALVPGIW